METAAVKREIHRLSFFPLLVMSMFLSCSSGVGNATGPAPWITGVQPPAANLGLPLISDLTPDPGFANGGYQLIDFNDAGGNIDKALRVFPTSDGGSWVAGFHTGPGLATQIAIVRLDANGIPDPAYNGTGAKLIPSTFTRIFDVARGPDDVLYFAGITIALPVYTDADVEIDCIDATGARCAAFANAGVDTEVFDLGVSGHHDDVAERIVYADGALYIAGGTDMGTDVGIDATDIAIFAMKLDATSGGGVAGFGNRPSYPGLYVMNGTLAANTQDVAYDLLVYAPTPATRRVILVGEVGQGDRRPLGFVSSLDGTTGLPDLFVDDMIFVPYTAGNYGAFRRIIARHDGGFVVAGYAADVDSLSVARFELLMAAFDPDGMRDSRFGLPGSTGVMHGMIASLANKPFGLAERAGSRDLVIGLNLLADTAGAVGYQGVLQVSASGTTLHAFHALDLPSTTLTVEGADLVIDGSRVLTAGDRDWSDTSHDFDMTVTRYEALDSIFADQFGGPASD